MYIEDELIKLLDKLKLSNYLKDLDKTAIAKELSFYMSELNVLHPFREGNGRTIREFIRQLAAKNGYLLNFQNIASIDILNACIKSTSDTSDLENLLMKCLEKDN